MAELATAAPPQPWFVEGRFSGTAEVHEQPRDDLPLSVKCRFGGFSRYRTRRDEYLVDDYGCLLMNAGQPYAFRTPTTPGVRAFNVFLPSEWIAAVLGDDIRLTVHQSYYRYTPSFACAVDALRHARATGDDIDERSVELLAEVLTTQRAYERFVASMPAARPNTRRRLAGRLSRARDFIYAEFARRLTLDAVAAHAMLSKFHLTRLYQAAYGLTPMRDLARKRAEQAQTLLVATDQNVTKIGAEVGFETTSAFVTAFRRATGATPTEFRRRSQDAGA